VILPLQTSFFEDYLGEGAETCGTGDELVKASLFCKENLFGFLMKPPTLIYFV
jgi:hypothetical protein